MSDKHLSRQPHSTWNNGDRSDRSINFDVWYYEEPKGLELIIQTRNVAGLVVGTTAAVIPWAQIRAALRRKDKKK